MSEKDPVLASLTELIKRHHYSRKDYKFDVNSLTTYNVCPLCGTINDLGTSTAEEGQEPGVFVTRNLEACQTCVNMKFLHPQVFEWVKQVITHAAFIEGLKAQAILKSGNALLQMNTQEIPDEEENQESSGDNDEPEEYIN